MAVNVPFVSGNQIIQGEKVAKSNSKDLKVINPELTC